MTALTLDQWFDRLMDHRDECDADECVDCTTPEPIVKLLRDRH